MAFVATTENPIPVGAQEFWFNGAGGMRVRAGFLPAKDKSRGTVLICPGRTEFIEKYFEVMMDLNGRGFACLCVDWRGQGLSDRYVKANPLKGHVPSFDVFALDLGAAVSEARTKFGDSFQEPLVMLAHSMGGGIGLRALQLQVVEVAAAAFSAPMWGIAKFNAAQRNYARAVRAVGLGKLYIPGASKTAGDEAFEGNKVTSDRKRFDRAQGLLRARPELQLAGPTLGWAAAAADVTAGFRKKGALNMVTAPVLIASAQNEMIVDNASHGLVAAVLPKARHVIIANARHEILFETDDCRAAFYSEFDALLTRANI